MKDTKNGAYGDTPLIIAVKNGDINQVNIILEADNSKETLNRNDTYGANPLYYAIISQEVQIIELLLNKKAHISFSSFNIAIKLHNPKIVKILLNHLDLRDRNYYTSLISAHGSEEMVRELIDSIASDHIDRFDHPLQSAIRNNNLDSVKVLLEQKNILRQKPFFYNSWLEYAINITDNQDIILALIEAGVDCSGPTYLRLAENRKLEKVVQTIQQKQQQIQQERSDKNWSLNKNIMLSSIFTYLFGSAFAVLRNGKITWALGLRGLFASSVFLIPMVAIPLLSRWLRDYCIDKLENNEFKNLCILILDVLSGEFIEKKIDQNLKNPKLKLAANIAFSASCSVMVGTIIATSSVTNKLIHFVGNYLGLGIKSLTLNTLLTRAAGYVFGSRIRSIISPNSNTLDAKHNTIKDDSKQKTRIHMIMAIQT